MTPKKRKYQEAPGFSTQNLARLQRLESHHHDLEVALSGLEALIRQRFFHMGLEGTSHPRGLEPPSDMDLAPNRASDLQPPESRQPESRPSKPRRRRPR
jgi:hypothetical protein